MEQGKHNDDPRNTNLVHMTRHESLQEATCVSRFESTAIGTFVKGLEHAIQALVVEHSSKTNGCLISYDTISLLHALTFNIDWMELFAQHDRQFTTTGSTNNSRTTTPLQLVVQALTENPFVFPIACHSIALHVCWQQIIRYCAQPRLAAVSFREPDDYLTRAQRHVWRTILRRIHAQKSPAAWKHLEFPRVDNQSTLAFRQCETLFRMLQELRQQQSMPDPILLGAALRVLRHAEPFSTSDDPTNTEPPVVPKRRTIKNQYNPFEASPDDVDIIDPEEVGLFKTPAIRQTKEASLPQILQQTTKLTDAKRASATLVDSYKWKEWRESLYDFAVSCTHAFTSTTTICAKRSVIDQIWSILLEEPNQSASLRFFLVDILTTDSGILQEWMQRLLDLAKVQDAQYNTCSTLALQFYTELLVELAVFDDLTVLQSTTTPFFEHLLAQNVDGRKSDQFWIWKRAFAFILSRRSPWLNSIPHFASINTSISLTWGTVEDWLDPNMSRQEQSRTITTLCQAGILGVCEAMEFATDTRKIAATDERWPFAKSNGIRMASRQYGKLYQFRFLFSVSMSGKGLAVRSNQSDPTEIGDFVQNFLHGDVLLRVFGYLGFKRMAHVHLVCRDWNVLAGHPKLWQSFFETRYGINQEDPVLQKGDQPWKEFFHHRFIVEKEIRSRGSTSNKKLLVCKYVGCNTIVSTPLQLTRHHGSHEKKTVKNESKAVVKKKEPRRKRKPVETKHICKKKPVKCPQLKEVVQESCRNTCRSKS